MRQREGPGTEGGSESTQETEDGQKCQGSGGGQNVRVVKPNLLFCVHQWNSEGICRSEWESRELSGSKRVVGRCQDMVFFEFVFRPICLITRRLPITFL